MMTTALSLAILTTVGAIIIYQKLPRKVRRFLEKHSFMTDLFTLFAVYALLGGTLTALMAGAMCGIMVSILLHIANNPNDYLYVYDAKELLIKKMGEAKQALNTYGAMYRERNQVTSPKVVPDAQPEAA